MNRESASSQAASTSRRVSEPALQKPGVRVAAALRDLIWRVEHVRTLLEEASAGTDPHELIDLLDTSDARAALDLNSAGAMQGGATNDKASEGGTNDR